MACNKTHWLYIYVRSVCTLRVYYTRTVWTEEDERGALKDSVNPVNGSLRKHCLSQRQANAYYRFGKHLPTGKLSWPCRLWTIYNTEPIVATCLSNQFDFSILIYFVQLYFCRVRLSQNNMSFWRALEEIIFSGVSLFYKTVLTNFIEDLIVPSISVFLF